MKDITINEIPCKNKDGINLISLFENLLRNNSSKPQETLSPQVILLMCYVHQKIYIIKILSFLLKSSDDMENPVERTEGKTNNSIQNKTTVTTNEPRLSGYFCSKTVFNLSNRALSAAEIRY